MAMNSATIALAVSQALAAPLLTEPMPVPRMSGWFGSCIGIDEWAEYDWRVWKIVEIKHPFTGKMRVRIC